MQLSPVPLIRPQTPVPAAPSTSSRNAFVARALGPDTPAQPWAPALPPGPQLAQPYAAPGRKPRGGENTDGRVWIASQTPLSQVLVARLDLRSPSAPVLLVQLPGERKLVRLSVCAATASRLTQGQGTDAAVALHPVGCSSTRRSWYFRAEPGNNAAWPPSGALHTTSAQPLRAPAPLASVTALRPHAGTTSAMPFVTVHAGEGGREALYVTRRFDEQFNEAGFSVHLADLPENAQVAGPTPAQLTTVHLDKDLSVAEVQQRDATILLQGAVTHADLATFFAGGMESPFIEVPYAASMVLVRLLGRQLATGSRSVAQWHAALTQTVRDATHQNAEVACA